jgi:putative aminopeptidase FrvX
MIYPKPTNRLLLLLSLLLLTKISNGQTGITNNYLLNVTLDFSKTSGVSGREEEAAAYVASLFAKGTLKKDKLGNLILSVGSGQPRILLTTPLDEPGYVISSIQDNGYMRIAPIGNKSLGTMYNQFLEGNEIKINTDKGSSYGVAVVPSSHYENLRYAPERLKSVYPWQEAVIDAGLSSAKEVNQKGIHLLDPLTANKKPQIIGGEYLCAPAAKSKSAAMALAMVARTLMQAKIKGTVVIAFTVLDLINGKGLEDVVSKYGPFDKMIRFDRFLNGPLQTIEGILADRKLPFTSENISITSPVTKNPELPVTEIYNIGLPANFANTPVEMVHVNDIQKLMKVWLSAVENKTWTIPDIKPALNSAHHEVFTTYNAEEKLLTKLVSFYGVSKAEKPVREYILSALPAWAKPVVDASGNIILTIGHGKDHIAFVAHMDEVGYVVDSIRSDGCLTLKAMGGFFNSVWEGHAAIIHADNKDIPAIFEPRANYMTATTRFNGMLTPTVFAGFKNKESALAAGIVEGETTVTMPKKMIRLSENRATARGFDDRAGCASLLLALQDINPALLTRRITFVWSVQEETGLAGSTFAANNLTDLSIVYPIDTFVSSDDPVDPRIFGYCPLGGGAVIRVLESINFISRDNLHKLQAISIKNHISTQYGMTAGGTDGQGFLKYDIPSVPLSWPGRYSHSPVEVMDFRDLHSLTRLILAITTTR